MRVASDVDPPSDASDPSSTTREEPEKQFEYEIALGSSGWLFVYYVGVVKAMRELGMARCVESSRVFASSRARWNGGSTRDGRASRSDATTLWTDGWRLSIACTTAQ